MSSILLILCASLVAFLGWLVVTEKVHMPILSDFGVSTIVVGLIVWADSYAARDELLGSWGLTVIALGLGLVGASLLRQKSIRRKADRHGDPKHIDGRHLGRIHGGKQ